MRKLNIISAKVLNLNLKFYPKWEDFVKNNKVIIDNYVNKEIKEPLKNIKDTKQRDKVFKREMQDCVADFTHTWNEMKKKQRI